MNLKKIAVFTLIVGLVPSLAFAANLNHRAYLGLGSGTIKMKDLDSSAGTGFSLGYECLKKLSDTRALTFGVEYNQINSESEDDTDAVLSTDTSWLTAPVLYHVTVAEKVDIFGGGFAALKVGEDSDLDGLTVSKDTTKGTNFGLIIGAGYSITDKVFARLQYNYGLADINDIDGIDSSKTSEIRFSVGYSFQ